MIEALITPSEKIRDWADPAFRIATSLIFIIGGLGHFGQHQVMLDRMVESPWWDVISLFGDPSWMLWLSGIVFVVFGITLALGWMTRLSAILIFLTLIPITITVHISDRFLSQTSVENARDPELRRAQSLVAQTISITHAKYPDDPAKASKEVEAKRQEVAIRIAKGDKIAVIQVRNQQAQRVREITHDQALQRQGRSR